MIRMSFDAVLSALCANSLQVSRRPEGVAFLRTARDLYRIERITYFCIDIASSNPRNVFSHCAYSDTEVMNCVSHYSLERDVIKFCLNTDAPAVDLQIPLHKHCGEMAAFEVTFGPGYVDDRDHATMQGELRILANYFHSHVLRINGKNVDLSVLISAKELDCLKWTAAGKTAWEASVILGITERTVRFHLNSAREKLQCTTTTQAVAKAIVNQLIAV